MTLSQKRLVGAVAVERDDRTLRALALLVGEDRSAISLTHFVQSRVEVLVDSSTLAATNGFLAVSSSLNMLSRFVGSVELIVLGSVQPHIGAALDQILSTLRRVDLRDGRSVCRTDGYNKSSQEGAVPAARLWIGSIPLDVVALREGRDVSIAFDAWSCILYRGRSAGQIIPSSIPFGALAASCFGVAEVFKALVAQSVPEQELAVFRRRFTHDWKFSAWTMDRMNAEVDTGPVALLELPRLPIDAVLQVGAGAVGNATALTFASTLPIAGELKLVDAKMVDVKGLNRCYYFTEDDVGDAKVVVLERTARRSGLRLRGIQRNFSTDVAEGKDIIISTVDNNEARHRIQESLPRVTVEGATGGTTVAVAVHSPGNGRSCLVCRHPDPTLGVSRRVQLSTRETAVLTGLMEDEIVAGAVNGTMEITEEVIARVEANSPTGAAILRNARNEGQDLCGAIGDLRIALGTVMGPREASIPFVSNLAGVLAAAETVKHLLHRQGQGHVPLLDNILQVDLARDYSRHAKLAFAEPPRGDCELCQQRGELIRTLSKAS